MKYIYINQIVAALLMVIVALVAGEAKTYAKPYSTPNYDVIRTIKDVSLMHLKGQYIEGYYLICNNKTKQCYKSNIETFSQALKAYEQVIFENNLL